MESYINDKKNLYTTILQYLENSDDNFDDTTKQLSIYFESITRNNKHQVKDGEFMLEFLQIIKNISDNHHRDQNLVKKTFQLLQHYKNQIKQTLSNDEIFHLFETNKLLVLFLLKNDILTLTESICEEMVYKYETNGERYCHFFYPELEHFLGEEKIEYIKKELLNKSPKAFDNYEEKRQEGQNDSLICSMIRNDSVEEFISHMNRNNYSLSSQITPSIFETNSFLIEQKNITLIEYSAFFGSIQIFQYLNMNGIELTPSLWLHVIHSKNAELIHMLETNNVCPPKFENINEKDEDEFNDKYLRCFVESIKCHHKDFGDYIENNFLLQEEKYSKRKEVILSNCIKYRNYYYFEPESIKNYGFFYLSLYNYNELVCILLKEKEKEINLKIIQSSNISMKN